MGSFGAYIIMKTLFTIILVFASLFANAQGGVSISANGSQPHPSAGLDISFNNKGLLIPRISAAQINAIASPALGLIVFNADCKTLVFWNGTSWAAMNNIGSLETPGISGNANPCKNQSGVIYSATPVVEATGYNWTVPSDATIVSGHGTSSIVVNFGIIGGDICVNASSSCKTSVSMCHAITLCP